MNTGAKGDKYYGRVAQNYERRRKKQPWWHVEQDEMKSLLEELPDNLKVLDVPFGTGRFVPYYLDKKFKVQGVDISDEMLKAAETALGDDYKKCKTSTGSATDLDFKDNSVDLLVSTRFLRDIIVAREAKQALAEFARVTKKYAIIQLGEKIEGPSEPYDPEVVLGNRLGSGETDALLAEVGFRVLDKRVVQRKEDENSLIFHILCEKG